MQRQWLLAAMTAVISGCASDPALGGDDLGGGGGKADDGIVEGSELAAAILGAANTASVELLDESWGAGLDARAARAIVATRAGADEMQGTADDVAFTTLAQLDAVSYVTASSLTRLGELVRGERVSRSRAMSDDYWQLLMPEGRLRVLEDIEYEADDAWIGMQIVKPTSGDPLAIASIADPKLRAYVTSIDTWMRANVNMDIMDIDGNHSTIGAPSIYWVSVLARTSDGSLLGASIGYYQLGCDMPDFDGDVRVFDNEAEAVAAGCQLSDVNWSTHAVFDRDGLPLLNDAAMEWSGY